MALVLSKIEIAIFSWYSPCKQRSEQTDGQTAAAAAVDNIIRDTQKALYTHVVRANDWLNRKADVFRSGRGESVELTGSFTRPGRGINGREGHVWLCRGGHRQRVGLAVTTIPQSYIRTVFRSIYSISLAYDAQKWNIWRVVRRVPRAGLTGQVPGDFPVAGGVRATIVR